MGDPFVCVDIVWVQVCSGLPGARFLEACRPPGANAIGLLYAVKQILQQAAAYQTIEAQRTKLFFPSSRTFHTRPYPDDARGAMKQAGNFFCAGGRANKEHSRAIVICAIAYPHNPFSRCGCANVGLSVVMPKQIRFFWLSYNIKTNESSVFCSTP